MPRQMFQLRIALADVSPPVWRRVLVPGGYTLDRVHAVIQHAMGWQGHHLHSFEIAGQEYGVPDPEDDTGPLDELDVRLDAVVGKGAAYVYVYDFGDWWHHDVQVEDVVTPVPQLRYPCVVDGAGQCPPEDVGGPAGHRELLAALARPEHPRHAQMREWIGRAYDPEAFDPGRASVLVRRLA